MARTDCPPSYPERKQLPVQGERTRGRMLQGLGAEGLVADVAFCPPGPEVRVADGQFAGHFDQPRIGGTFRHSYAEERDARSRRCSASRRTGRGPRRRGNSSRTKLRSRRGTWPKR